jgi:hypothetical protein
MRPFAGILDDLDIMADHHYIPQFYLKQWTSGQSRLYEYSRPRDIVKARQTSPKGTGYIPGLYNITGAAPDKIDLLEQNFFRNIDQNANDVMTIFLSGHNASLTDEQRTHWSTFMISLDRRHPEELPQIHARARLIIDDNVSSAGFEIKDPDVLARTETAVSLSIQSAILIPESTRFLNSLTWQVGHLPHGNSKLLTCDRPFLRIPGCFALPLSPHLLFVAADSELVFQWINNRADNHTLADFINDIVVRQAALYVYACDNNQSEFIEKRLRARA